MAINTPQQDAIDRLIKNKLRFCPSGECYWCGKDLCKKLDLDNDEPITHCDGCNRSFVE